jgi:hypothetical protein
MRVAGLLLIALAACSDLLGVGNLRDLTDAAADVVDSSSDADAGIVECPDEGICSTFPQCGCGTENCVVLSTAGVTGCVPVGTTPLWYDCSGVNPETCERGATCIGGVCKPFCGSASDCTGTNVTCDSIDQVGTNVPIPNLFVCSSGCDPVNPSAICGPGVTCFPYPWDGLEHDHGNCIGGAGTGVGSGACVGKNNDYPPCAPGYYCTLAGDCLHWCRVGLTDCANGETCVGISPPPTAIEGVTYGLCVDGD